MSRAETYTRYPRTILWLCQGGETVIGGDEVDASPRFRVEVEPFYLSKWPITNEQFEAFDPGFERHPLAPGSRDPAIGVSWEQADAYCRWYAELSRKPMRLPTEIEWEHACRAGSTARYFWGEDPEGADLHLWELDATGTRLEPPNRKRGNGFGLHGMLGGVWEWTASRYRPYPLAGAGVLTDPERSEPPRGQGSPRSPAAAEEVGEEADEERRVLRGGSYRLAAREITCSRRLAMLPDARVEDAGFRVAKSLRG